MEEIFGENALVLTKEIKGVTYNTYIYDYDGNLMELFARSDLGSFYPQSGQRILEVDSFDIEEVSDGLFRADVIMSDGLEDYLYITRRSN